MTKVVNVKTDKFDIYIGRGKGDTLYHFGNPFSHLPFARTTATIKVETREEAVDCYRQWLKGVGHTDLEPDRRQWILERLSQLKGKILGCWCTPEACHGDVLVEMINESQVEPSVM